MGNETHQPIYSNRNKLKIYTYKKIKNKEINPFCRIGKNAYNRMEKHAQNEFTGFTSLLQTCDWTGLQKQNPVWAHSGAPVPPSRPSQLETAAARCRSRSIRVARQGPAAHLLHSVRISREEDQQRILIPASIPQLPIDACTPKHRACLTLTLFSSSRVPGLDCSASLLDSWRYYPPGSGHTRRALTKYHPRITAVRLFFPTERNTNIW